MLDLIGELGNWAWLLAGAVLMLLELAAPGAFLFWLGLAAVATGVLGFVVTLGWQLEILSFAVLAVAFVLLARKLTRRDAGPPADAPFLNRRGDALIGRVFVLDEPIVNGVGRVRVDDSTWRVLGPDTDSGSRVRVTGVDGSTLRIEPA